MGTKALLRLDLIQDMCALRWRHCILFFCLQHGALMIYDLSYIYMWLCTWHVHADSVRMFLTYLLSGFDISSCFQTTCQILTGKTEKLQLCQRNCKISVILTVSFSQPQRQRCVLTFRFSEHLKFYDCSTLSCLTPFNTAARVIGTEAISLKCNYAVCESAGCKQNVM